MLQGQRTNNGQDCSPLREVELLPFYPLAKTSSLYYAHCTLHTAHCTMHTAHCTLHTANCTPQAVDCGHLTLHIVRCIMHASHYRLYKPYSILYTVDLILYTAHCTCAGLNSKNPDPLPLEISCKTVIVHSLTLLHCTSLHFTAVYST
jgi:hypothetical protein